MTTSRILETAGWVQDFKALPRGPEGRALCRYCGREVPKGRRTFCGGDRATFVRGSGLYVTAGSGCVHEHCVRSDPGYARSCVWARDRGLCQLCGAVGRRHAGRGAGEWHADHIVPVVEGGGACALDNLRTLCRVCHSRETAKLAARRALARRASP
jgi:5-methylcytosine-specific restriction enzyme A